MDQKLKKGGGMMRRSWIPFLSFVAVAILFPTLLPAQDRVSMSAPVIRTSTGEVSISARFQGLNPERNYRIGIGVTGQFPESKIEIARDDTPVAASLDDFIQGHTSNWWGVEQLTARGFQLDGNDLGSASEELVLRISIPQAEADKLENIYLFISRNYGGKTWYLEDGADLDNSYW